MTNQALLNRRFIRLQAVLHLYAFYVSQKANYNQAIDQLRADFVPDVFADPPEDRSQLASAMQEALSLFASSALRSSNMHLSGTRSLTNRVNVAVHHALERYACAVAQDRRKLEAGLQETVAAINQACVRIWQLLVTWACVARKQAGKPILRQRRMLTLSEGLSCSTLLQRLYADDTLAPLARSESVSWENHRLLVEGWYRQYIAKNAASQRCFTYPLSPDQEKLLLKVLIEEIVFKNKAIQSFFCDVDLRWPIHKHIVSKLVLQGLHHLIQAGQDSMSTSIFILADNWKAEQHFYTSLVCKTLQQDVALNALIAKSANKWTLDRIILLDKVVIKLALCEMMYFTDIPIKVSMNEYISLSKIYSMPKSSQFVNGVLDAVAATL